MVGEIRPLSDQGISSANKISRRKLLQELRDTRATKSGGELLLGEMKVIQENATTAVVSITFNAEKHSWDYSWKSNRWSGVNNSHVVDVILVQSLSYVTNTTVETETLDDNLEVYSNACGATFLILSSHKSPHLKRKLSAAAATATGEEGEDSPVGHPSASSDGQTRHTLVPKYPIKRRESFSSTDPMGALLMALADGDKGSGSGPRPDPSTPRTTTYTSNSIPNNIEIVAKMDIDGSTLAVTDETHYLPPKRQRMKSMKLKEYTESTDEGEGSDLIDCGDDISYHDHHCDNCRYTSVGVHVSIHAVGIRTIEI